jgi:DNA-binding transcriptional ArsR family regulator
VARPARPARNPFEALGDPNRRAIVELLGAGPSGGRSVGELARALPISRPAVSRHLRLLKEAGLVVEEPLGTRRLYRLHDEGLGAVRAYLDRVWGDAAGRFRLVAENTFPPAPPGPPAPRPGEPRPREPRS